MYVILNQETKTIRSFYIILIYNYIQLALLM